MKDQNRFTNAQPVLRVYNQSGDMFGVKTGGTRRCGMDGCRGRLIGVRWPTGELTFPCVDGLVPHPTGAVQIG